MSAPLTTAVDWAEVHEHYAWPNRTGRFTPIAASDIAVGDRVWLRHPDGFNPWYQPCLITAIVPSSGGSAYVTVDLIGKNGVAYDISRDRWGDRRWIPAPADPTDLVCVKAHAAYLIERNPS